MSLEVSAPKVAIVGRMNVGKSTLFNRLIEEQKSLVSDIPGTTRDRYEGDCIWRGQVIRLIDTGGLDMRYEDDIEKHIAAQARFAIEEAEVIVFAVDARTGLQPEDRQLAKELMDTKKPVITIANKADNRTLQESVNTDTYNWPLDLPMAVSAKRGTGTGDLLDLIYEELEKAGKPAVDITEIATTRISVLGRPNVGKSSLLNTIIGEERFIASPMEHTTRGPNDTIIDINNKRYALVDTAGMRKKARVRASKSRLEKKGVDQTRGSVTRADVILFVLDITQRIQSQDKHIGGDLADSGVSVVIVANKWDLIPDKDPNTINEYEKYIRAHLPMLHYAPIIFTSAVTGQRVPAIFDIIDHIFQTRFTQLSDKETKRFMSQAIMKHKPSRGKGIKHPRIIGFRQRHVNPPTFDLHIDLPRKEALNPSYVRFLMNLLREEYDFEGTPIKIVIRARKKSHTT